MYIHEINFQVHIYKKTWDFLLLFFLFSSLFIIFSSIINEFLQLLMNFFNLGRLWWLEHGCFCRIYDVYMQILLFSFFLHRRRNRKVAKSLRIPGFHLFLPSFDNRANLQFHPLSEFYLFERTIRFFAKSFTSYFQRVPSRTILHIIDVSIRK